MNYEWLVISKRDEQAKKLIQDVLDENPFMLGICWSCNEPEIHKPTCFTEQARQYLGGEKK